MAALSQVDDESLEEVEDLNFDIIMDLENLGEQIEVDMLTYGLDSDGDLLAALAQIEQNANSTEEPTQPAPATSVFATLSEADLLDIEAAKDTKSTKLSTNWGVRRFKGNFFKFFALAKALKQKIICYSMYVRNYFIAHPL